MIWYLNLPSINNFGDPEMKKKVTLENHVLTDKLTMSLNLFQILKFHANVCYNIIDIFAIIYLCFHFTL